MNGDLLLKVQAWVDGELPADEARQVESLVATDQQAAALAGELRLTRSFLRGNELEAKVPDSPEFYWSQIRRAIERAETADAAPGPQVAGISLWTALRRFMVPASGLALVMLVAALSVKYFGPTSLEDATPQLVEVENLSEEMGSISYRSQADKMFVVYVYAKDQDLAEDDSQADGLDDLLFR
jgi:anti-sigma factor RsiW